MKNQKSKPFACSVCNRRYAKEKWWKNHESTVHANRPNENGANNSPIGRKNRTKTLAAVVRQGSKPEIIQKICLKPKMEVSNPKSSESHPFSCDICDKRYLRKRGLSHHIYQIHVKRRFKSIATDKQNLPIADVTILETLTVHPEKEL